MFLQNNVHTSGDSQRQFKKIHKSFEYENSENRIDTSNRKSNEASLENIPETKYLDYGNLLLFLRKHKLMFNFFRIFVR